MSGAATGTQDLPPGPTIGRRDSARIAVAALISAGTGYVILMIAARVLPKEVNSVFVTFWGMLFACFGVLSGLSIESTRAVTAEGMRTRGARTLPSTPGTEVPDERHGPHVITAGLCFGITAGSLLAATSPLWGTRIFPHQTVWLTLLVSAGIGAYAGHSVVVGSLAGRHAWQPYSLLITADALVRLGLVVAAALLLGNLVGLAAATTLATVTWAGYLVVSGRARSAAMARVDSPAPTFLRRAFVAALATGAGALLVVGFPVLLSSTTDAGLYAQAAPLVYAITFTRAPLMIPLTAYQGVAVSHFVQHRDRGMRALVPLARAVLLVGVAGSGLAWLIGPWMMTTLFSAGYWVAGPVLAGLTLGATGIALLTLTGALCQALTRHTAFLCGWVVAVVGAVLVLMTPLGIEARAVLALCLGPLAGIAVHAWALRGSVDAGAPTEPAHATDADGPPPAGPDDVPVTVCMSTFDGATFVVEQLRSILDQLGPDDEVVVVDDASADDTVLAIRTVDDPRVRVVESDTNRGYVRTFEQAMQGARGRHLLLSDQDDVWEPGRVATMVAALDRVEVVATNLSTLDGPPRIRGPYGQADWRLRASASGHHGRNIFGILAGNRPYYGSAMGLRRESLARVLPFPDFLDESHDLWIALYGNVARSVEHVEVRSVRRRFHATNASPNRPRGLRAVARSRLMLLRSWLELRRRCAGGD